ncbi:MAG: ATP-dependent DNA helicase [Thermoplasmatota archaeon]
MASFCPTCKGLMRPSGGTLQCIHCSRAGRARTVMKGGRSIRLQEGQQGLLGTGVEQAAAAAVGVEPTLTPQDPSWQPPAGGAPHPELGLFPHDTIRDGQRRFTRDVTMALRRRKHLVAQAPTGIGKTAASLAPALAHAMESGQTVLFLTSRQSQHRIAVDTVRLMAERRGVRPRVVDLVSKRDMCLRPEANEMHPANFPDFCARETRTRSCSYLDDVGPDALAAVRAGVLHVEELMKVGKNHHLCPHLLATEAAQEAHVVVADYNHLFSDIRERSLEKFGLELGNLVVIVDEAHNLPDRIRQNHTHRVTPYLLDQVEGEARQHKAREVQADLDALREALDALAAQAQKEGRAEDATLGGGDALVARLEIDDLHKAFEAARNKGTLGLHRTLQDVIDDLGPVVAAQRKGTDAQVHAEQLQEALEDWGRFHTGALRFIQWEDGQVQLHVRLLDPSVPARSVFQQVASAVLMSGTLRPPEMVRDLLGLEEERSTVRVYPSPFPPENRPISIAQGMSTRYRERGEKLWTRIGRIIADTAASTKGNLAVFAPSYAILRDVRHAVLDQAPDKELILEEQGLSKGERDAVLDQLEGAKRRRRGAILMGVLGGSFSEGVDFKDGLLSAVIVVGLPLAPPDLEVQATIGYLEAKFKGRGRAYGYTYPAMNKVLQAMGRGIRSPTDRCAVMLLDQRYLEPTYRRLLPEDAPLIPSPDPAFTLAAFLSAQDL